MENFKEFIQKNFGGFSRSQYGDNSVILLSANNLNEIILKKVFNPHLITACYFFGRTPEGLNCLIQWSEERDCWANGEIDSLKLKKNVWEERSWAELTQFHFDLMDRFDGFKKTGKEVMLDIGAGLSRRPGCISVDITNASEIVCDITKERLPFDDNSVDRVYSCHTFEHLSDREIHPTMTEIYRVLKPGAKLHAMVPHFNRTLASGVHAMYWSRYTLREFLGKDRIYTGYGLGYCFKMNHLNYWAKRSDQLHMQFIFEKTTEEEIQKYVKHGDSCEDVYFENKQYDYYLQEYLCELEKLETERFGK